MSTAAYLIAGCRTPIGKLLGGLSPLPAPRFGAVAIAEAIRRAGVPGDAVEEVIMEAEMSCLAGDRTGSARNGRVCPGCPTRSPAVTINKMCGSGQKAVMLADQAIRARRRPGDRGRRHGEHERPVCSPAAREAGNSATNRSALML